MPSTESTMAELLETKSIFDTFSNSLLSRGWVSDADMGITRVATKWLPSASELEVLCARYGNERVQELSLRSTAFDCDALGFLYFIFDEDTFPDYNALRASLRRHGIQVK